MSDSAPEPTTSPYGPAATAAAAATDPVGEQKLERARRGLRIAALVSGVLSVLITVTLVVLAALGMGTADNDLAGVGEAVTFGLIFAAPVLFVIALNLLTWRALLRPLARMGVGGRIALVIVMVLVLGIVSVALVAALLFGGFFVGAMSSAGSGF